MEVMTLFLLKSLVLGTLKVVGGCFFLVFLLGFFSLLFLRTFDVLSAKQVDNAKKYLKNSVTRFLLKGTAMRLCQHRAVRKCTLHSLSLLSLCHLTECDEWFYFLSFTNLNDYFCQFVISSSVHKIITLFKCIWN